MTHGLLEFEGVTKSYGQTVALNAFSHRFTPGRVHALMGKNGSGKSTLVKLVAGVIVPSAGQIRVNGRLASFQTPQDAFDAGIVTVHQELSLVPELSIAENIYLGRAPMIRRFGLDVIAWTKLYADAARLLEEMGLNLDPRKPVSSLGVGQQQVVEITKAMSFDPAILLLDEPTSALASREVAQLFSLVRRLRERGVTVLYITHRMNEIFEIADTCTVLRDGNLAGSIEMAGASPDTVVEMMFGDIAMSRRPPRRAIDRSSQPVLEVEGLGRKGAFSDITFKLYRGEVLGIAGLLGAGRSEVMRSIFGADRYDRGTVTIDGVKTRVGTPKAMKRRGLGYTPENRKEVGLVQLLSTHDNLCLASLNSIASIGPIRRASERPFVKRQIENLAIKVPDPLLPVSALSGGNQQKVVIGNWLNTAPKVMFFDEPSRGVDVQAKQQIFEIIWRLAEGGLAAIFVSTELEEVLEVADRVLVMREGRIVAEVDPVTTPLTALYRLSMEGTPN